MQNQLKRKFVIMIWGLMVFGSALAGLGHHPSLAEGPADVSAETSLAAGRSFGDDKRPDHNVPDDNSTGRNWY